METESIFVYLLSEYTTYREAMRQMEVLIFRCLKGRWICWSCTLLSQIRIYLGKSSWCRSFNMCNINAFLLSSPIGLSINTGSPQEDEILPVSHEYLWCLTPPVLLIISIIHIPMINAFNSLPEYVSVHYWWYLWLIYTYSAQSVTFLLVLHSTVNCTNIQLESWTTSHPMLLFKSYYKQTTWDLPCVQEMYA